MTRVMDKFIVSISSDVSSTNPNSCQNVDGYVGDSGKNVVGDDVKREKRARVENIYDGYVISDPALRKPINECDPLVRDGVIREYVLKGPFQPLSQNFPRSDFGKKSRCFQAGWFKQWEWLEYSVSKDAAFCFWCYLFRGDSGKRFGDDVFVKTGFRDWKRGTEKIREHAGVASSRHNDARALFFAFKDQMQSLSRNVSSKKRVGQELNFRGHDELAVSLNRGNLFEVLDCYNPHNVDVASASERARAGIIDIGDKLFSLLIDEALDSSVKEKMDVVVRYVKNHGVVVERFLGSINVVDTTALSLKSGIDELFAKHGLSISKLRGQGYHGASYMRGELDGLKTLILNENPCAKYIHCFAHQLQLVIVVVSQKNRFVSEFFEFLSMITNMVGASCKRKDEFKQKQHENMVEVLETGEILTGRGLHRVTTLAQPGATRWGSHYAAIIRLLCFWPSTIQVLENIFDDGTELNQGFAASLAEKMESYQFVFIAHLMKQVLGSTIALSEFLQQNDRNILVALSLIRSTKKRLQDLRENGWDELLVDVNNFCVKNELVILNMEDNAPCRFLSRRVGHAITNYHQLRVDIFGQVMDEICEEMENRFSDSVIELLTCITCLDPKNSFSNFSQSKLLRLAELYPLEFSVCDQMELKEQLKMWICEMRGSESFSTLQDIGALAKKMVEPAKVPTACIGMVADQLEKPRNQVNVNPFNDQDDSS